MVATIAAIIYMERAQRRIPVQYAKRVVGRRVYSGQSSHLPLKVNTSGRDPAHLRVVDPALPGTITGFIDHPVAHWVQQTLSPGSWVYELVYVALIVFFCYFYPAVSFNPTDVAENMKKFGGYIPGIRPGPRTAEYIDRVLTRITLSGALYVAAVCVLPTVLVQQFNVRSTSEGRRC
jgi:preprotein translocase subunit SecY